MKSQWKKCAVAIGLALGALGAQAQGYGPQGYGFQAPVPGYVGTPMYNGYPGGGHRYPVAPAYNPTPAGGAWGQNPYAAPMPRPSQYPQPWEQAQRGQFQQPWAGAYRAPAQPQWNAPTPTYSGRSHYAQPAPGYGPSPGYAQTGGADPSVGYTPPVTYNTRAANPSGGVPMPNREFQTAARCAATSGGNLYAAAGCTATQLTTTELQRCANGIGTPGGCFGPNNTIRTTTQNTINDVTRGPGSIYGSLPVLPGPAAPIIGTIRDLFGF